MIKDGRIRVVEKHNMQVHILFKNPKNLCVSENFKNFYQDFKGEHNFSMFFGFFYDDDFSITSCNFRIGSDNNYHKPTIIE